MKKLTNILVPQFTSLQYDSACRGDIVTEFLNKNKFPAHDAYCEIDTPPFGVPLPPL
jgi:hypothetical protein